MGLMACEGLYIYITFLHFPLLLHIKLLQIKPILKVALVNCFDMYHMVLFYVLYIQCELILHICTCCRLFLCFTKRHSGPGSLVHQSRIYLLLCQHLPLGDHCKFRRSVDCSYF